MIRDAIYDLVARYRYRWFGRRDARILPIVRGHREPPRNCGTMALASARMTKEAALLQFNSVPDAGEQLKALGHNDHPTWAI